jgi:hypothetical protein
VETPESPETRPGFGAFLFSEKMKFRDEKTLAVPGKVRADNLRFEI